MTASDGNPYKPAQGNQKMGCIISNTWNSGAASDTTGSRTSKSILSEFISAPLSSMLNFFSGRKIVQIVQVSIYPISGPWKCPYNHHLRSKWGTDSLQPHELQHTRPPCPSPTPKIHPNSCASSWWCHPACYMLSCLCCIWLFETLWTVALQTLLSMGFSRQEYWSGLPCPPPRDRPNSGSILGLLPLLHLQAGSLPLASPVKPHLGTWIPLVSPMNHIHLSKGTEWLYDISPLMLTNIQCKNFSWKTLFTCDSPPISQKFLQFLFTFPISQQLF